MSRHNVFISLSRPQAEYLLEAIEIDMAADDLDGEELDRAEKVCAKIERALRKAKPCAGPGCPCSKGRES